MSPEQINEMIQERMATAIRVIANDLDENIPSIFAGHLTVGGSQTSSEKSMMLGRDHVLPIRRNTGMPAADSFAMRLANSR